MKRRAMPEAGMGMGQEHRDEAGVPNLFKLPVTSWATGSDKNIRPRDGRVRLHCRNKVGYFTIVIVRAPGGRCV